MMVRFYLEQRAVGLPTQALERQMDEADLEELQEKEGLYVVNATILRDTLDTLDYYDVIGDREEDITDFVATPAEQMEYPELIQKVYGSQVNFTTANTTTESLPEETLRRVRRSVTQIYESLTNTTLYHQKELRLISDQDQLNMIIARHRLHLEQGNLTMDNLRLLQEEVQKIRKQGDGKMAEIAEANRLFLVKVMKYLKKEQDPDLGVLAMILQPQQVERIIEEKIPIGERLLATQIAGGFEPLTDLSQKNALLSYMMGQQEIRIKKHEEDMKRNSEEELKFIREKRTAASMAAGVLLTRQQETFIEEYVQMLGEMQDRVTVLKRLQEFCLSGDWHWANIMNRDCWQYTTAHQIRSLLSVVASILGVIVVATTAMCLIQKSSSGAQQSNHTEKEEEQQCTQAIALLSDAPHDDEERENMAL